MAKGRTVQKQSAKKVNTKVSKKSVKTETPVAHTAETHHAEHAVAHVEAAKGKTVRQNKKAATKKVVVAKKTHTKAAAKPKVAKKTQPKKANKSSAKKSSKKSTKKH